MSEEPDCYNCRYRYEGGICEARRVQLGDDCWKAYEEEINHESSAFMVVFKFRTPGEHVVYAKFDNTTGKRIVMSEPIGDGEDPGVALRRVMARADTVDDDS